MTYDAKKIADELILTALGKSYYGNALYVALDLPMLTTEDKDCLHRYLHGAELNSDHVLLQDIANRIIKTAKEICVYPMSDTRSQATPASSQIITLTLTRMYEEAQDALDDLRQKNAEKAEEIARLNALLGKANALARIRAERIQQQDATAMAHSHYEKLRSVAHSAQWAMDVASTLCGTLNKIMQGQQPSF